MIVGLFIPQFLSQNPTPLALSEKTIGEPLEQRRLKNQTTQNKDLNNAFEQIDNKNYLNAINILSGLYQNSIDENEVALGLGYAYMMNSQYDEAAEIFNQGLKLDLKKFDKIKWYLAHSYLRNEQYDKSIATLESMLGSTSVTKKKKIKVQSLIEKIKKHYSLN